MTKLEFFEKHSKNWDDYSKKSDLNKIKNILDDIKIKKGSRIIDIGCGTGILLPFLRKASGAKSEITALDYSKGMLRIVRRKFKNQFKYICSKIEKTTLKSRYFDYAICFSVFPHFNHKMKALLEINRILKLEGKLLIAHAMGRKHLNEFHKRNSKEVSGDMLPSKSKMKHMIDKAGFLIEKFYDKSDKYVVFAKKVKIL